MPFATPLGFALHAALWCFDFYNTFEGYVVRAIEKLYRDAYSLILPDRTLPVEVPPEKYVPSEGFVRKVVSSLSDGNVTLGTGRVFSSKDHEEKLAALKSLIH